MATKFLNRYGESLNEIEYDTTQYLSTTGTAAAANKLATARTITLGSDCSGSVSFDGSSNVTLNVTVKDDSHNHTIANIDNLQSNLNNLSSRITTLENFMNKYNSMLNIIGNNA